jgi:hypothetical protein
MDDLTTDFNDLIGADALNGSTAPNSSALSLTTPVNTSDGNTNTSGFSLGSFITGLAGLGTTAANAYQAVAGQPAALTAKPAANKTTAATVNPIVWVGVFILGAVLIGWLVLQGGSRR